LAAGELALAERHFELARPEEREREDFHVRLALAAQKSRGAWTAGRADPPLLARRRYRRGHRLRPRSAQPGSSRRHRGGPRCINLEHLFESQVLLEEIERVDAIASG